MPSYQEAIETVLKTFSDMVVKERAEIELICDRENDLYLVMVVCWSNQTRIYSMNIAGVPGLTNVEKAMLKILDVVENSRT